MEETGKHASGLSDPARDQTETSAGLYFFPEDDVSEDRVRRILADGTPEERAWVVSHLLRFAQWDDIWEYVERETVREIFPALELPESLRSAWARMLKIEVEVG